MINPSNQVTIIGNVGAAPMERAKNRDGNSVVGLAIAQSLTRMDAATGQPTHKGAQWFQVTCFAGLADKVRTQLTKGDWYWLSANSSRRRTQSKSGEPRTHRDHRQRGPSRGATPTGRNRSLEPACYR